MIGVIERDGGTLYCTALFLSPAGELLGKHRKLMPTGAERLVWGTGDGSTMPVLDTPLGRLGAVICWENYMPLMRMAMYAKGIQLYCAPTADARETWVASMRHIACEGRCFVLSANQFATPRRLPGRTTRSTSPTPDDVLCTGGSVIVSPLGELLAGPETGGETILRAELDLDRIAEGKYDFDVIGHYARPDVFSLADRRAAQAPGRVRRRASRHQRRRDGARHPAAPAWPTRSSRGATCCTRGRCPTCPTPSCAGSAPAFLAGEDAADIGTAAEFERRDRTLAEHRDGEYVLWFEADLYDQLQLVQILATLHALARARPSASR